MADQETERLYQEYRRIMDETQLEMFAASEFGSNSYEQPDAKGFPMSMEEQARLTGIDPAEIAEAQYMSNAYEQDHSQQDTISDYYEAYADVAGDATLAHRLENENAMDILEDVRREVHGQNNLSAYRNGIEADFWNVLDTDIPADASRGDLEAAGVAATRVYDEASRQVREHDPEDAEEAGWAAEMAFNHAMAMDKQEEIKGLLTGRAEQSVNPLEPVRSQGLDTGR